MLCARWVTQTFNCQLYHVITNANSNRVPNPGTAYKKEIRTCPLPDLAKSSILKTNKISAKPRAGIIEAKFSHKFTIRMTTYYILTCVFGV